MILYNERSRTASASHQKRPHQNATNTISLWRNRSKISEADRYPPAHNGLVAGSSPAGPTNDINDVVGARIMPRRLARSAKAPYVSKRLMRNEFRSPETPTRRSEDAMDDRNVRVALERHWDASDASEFQVEHEIYREDAVLDYPQSGERIRGRHNIQESRTVQPNTKRFTVRRIVGSGDLWVTEFILSYDGKPSYAVSIMEFRDGLVANETQYFADRFDPSPSRAHLVE
jgi:hypothetical protein